MWARSEVGLSRLPVTEEIAGSNPVGPATKIAHLSVGYFCARLPQLKPAIVYTYFYKRAEERSEIVRHPKPHLMLANYTFLC